MRHVCEVLANCVHSPTSNVKLLRSSRMFVERKAATGSLEASLLPCMKDMPMIA